MAKKVEVRKPITADRFLVLDTYSEVYQEFDTLEEVENFISEENRGGSADSYEIEDRYHVHPVIDADVIRVQVETKLVLSFKRAGEI